jgi:predicted heme/steroid binding protein
VSGEYFSVLAKVARLDQLTDGARLEAARRAESEHIVSESLYSLSELPGAERAHALSRDVVRQLRSSTGRDTWPAELAELRRQARVCRLGQLGSALDELSRRLEALQTRLGWLLHGTSPAELASLDPVADSDRIHQHLLATFRAESRLAETLAINRVATSESLLLFLRSTRESERNPVTRFLDTYALFANFFEWGEQSQRGSAAVRRINQIHGRYYLPNEGMKYVLLNTAFTWLDGIERIGHRPLGEREREGFFNAYVRLGRAMHIAGLTHDYTQMYAWFRGVNRENARHTRLKTETFELFVGNSFGSVAIERELMLSMARAAMDDDYRAALGYAAPSASELNGLRLAVKRLAAQREACPQVPWLRSLESTPGSAAPSPPEQLGVSARSASLPQARLGAANGGYPEGQTPVQAGRAGVAVDLPLYDWAEIRGHTSELSTWIVIDGEVYDVSGWISEHPGGSDVLRAWAGRDASLAFHTAPHGALTQVLRLNYRIGRVREAPVESAGRASYGATTGATES